MLSDSLSPLSLFSGLIQSMSTLKQRIEEMMQETGMDERAVAAAAGVSRSAVIQWLGKGGDNSKEIKSLGVRPACKLEEATGFKALWLATGDGARKTAEPIQQAAPTYEMWIPAGVLDDATMIQLAHDLKVLTPARRSKLVDMIHEEAEAARELLKYHQGQSTAAPAPSMAAGIQSSAKKTITIRRGDGNPDQGELSFSVLNDPFTAQPSKRENQWYGTLGPTKKPHGI